MKLYLSFLVILVISRLCASAAPHIVFDRTHYNFGPIRGADAVSGAFIVKNEGDAPLVIEPPMPSCECTVPSWNGGPLAPGATGELTFVLKIAQLKRVIHEKIRVICNDPASRTNTLEISVDYTPLYELKPFAVNVSVPRLTSTNVPVALFRTDDKPFQIVRVETAQPWISAAINRAAGDKTQPATFSLSIKADAKEGQYQEKIRVFTADDTNKPAAIFGIVCDVLAEYLADPPMIYWQIPDRERFLKEAAKQEPAKRVSLKRMTGKPFKVKRLEALTDALVLDSLPQTQADTVEFKARLVKTPEATILSKVRVELADPPGETVEIPVTISVVWRPSSNRSGRGQPAGGKEIQLTNGSPAAPTRLR